MIKHVLFEIGVEELPARFIDHAEKELYENTENWLQDSRINYENITSFSTPRRLAVMIHNVDESPHALTKGVRGPATRIANEGSGDRSKAAIGLTKGQGMSPEDIYTREVEGVEYISAEKTIEGKQTKQILPGFKDIINPL